MIHSKFSIRLLTGGFLVSCLSGPVIAADRTWDGGADVIDWVGINSNGKDGAKNWNGNNNIQAGDSLVFAGSVKLTNNNNFDAGTNFGNITFNSDASAFTLGGSSITLGGAVTNNSTALQTINLPLILSATRTFNANTGNLAVGGVISGTDGLTKTGGNVLTLTGTNIYKGATTVSEGTLVINGIQSSATGNVTVASGATLAGTGTVGGTTTISGTHSAGTVGTVGTQTFSGGVTYGSGSIFSWDLNANAHGTKGTDYDGVSGTATAATGSIFKVVLGNSVDLNNTFWSSTQTWAMTDIFTSFSGNFNTIVTSSANPLTQGAFTITGDGSTLTWSAVPEPTSALAGLLLAAGLLRRRRRFA